MLTVFSGEMRAGHAAQASGQPNLVYRNARTHSLHNTLIFY
jgi:hypothetical protein